MSSGVFYYEEGGMYFVLFSMGLAQLPGQGPGRGALTGANSS